MDEKNQKVKRGVGALQITVALQQERCLRLIAEGKIKGLEDFCRYGLCPLICCYTDKARATAAA